MRRIKLEISYDGTHYSGWQRQHDRRTIQQCIEEALEPLAGAPVEIRGSSRTDAGVHALKQVAAFSTEASFAADVFRRAGNDRLPQDIRIMRAEEVPVDFCPIKDAVSKRYRYLLCDQTVWLPHLRHYVWFVKNPLDADVMHEAAQKFLGEHDFAAFQTHGSPRQSTVRTIFDIQVKRIREPETVFPVPAPLVVVEVAANGFLYKMVRTIVGTLIQKPESVAEILAAKDRRLAGLTAPPQGLFLIDIQFGNQFGNKPGA